MPSDTIMNRDKDKPVSLAYYSIHMLTDQNVARERYCNEAKRHNTQQRTTTHPFDQKLSRISERRSVKLGQNRDLSTFSISMNDSPSSSKSKAPEKKDSFDDFSIHRNNRNSQGDAQSNENERFAYKKLASKTSPIPTDRSKNQSKNIEEVEKDSHFSQSTLKPSTHSAKDKPTMPFYPSSDVNAKSDYDNSIESFELSERVFMNSLLKHTAIALTIIVPLAAMTAYAATPAAPDALNDGHSSSNHVLSAVDNNISSSKMSAQATQNSGVPTAVDSVDLSRYAGVWYEIGRLPMYFQRHCVGNVTATYTPQVDSQVSGNQKIAVLNQCVDKDGQIITAEGEATPVDSAGSKLKVTFLPKWLRWAPIGRANYWVLALDDSYQSALVGTPDNKYLWILSRSPDLNDETYQKYRTIAQNQGYDLSNFKLTPQDVSAQDAREGAE